MNKTFLTLEVTNPDFVFHEYLFRKIVPNRLENLDYEGYNQSITESLEIKTMCRFLICSDIVGFGSLIWVLSTPENNAEKDAVLFEGNGFDYTYKNLYEILRKYIK